MYHFIAGLSGERISFGTGLGLDCLNHCGGKERVSWFGLDLPHSMTGMACALHEAREELVDNQPEAD